MYQVKTFFSIVGESETIREYKDWLAEIQQREEIEIVSVVNLDGTLLVTYKLIDKVRISI